MRYRAIRQISTFVALTPLGCGQGSGAPLDSDAGASPPQDAAATATPPVPTQREGRVCGDTNTNPTSCGVCGRSCLGAPCSDGFCEPAVLAGSIAFPRGIGLTPTEIFTSAPISGTPLGRIPIGGGLLTLAYETGQTPLAMTLDAGVLYWLTPTTLGSYRLVNGAVTTVAVAASAPQLLVSGGRLIFVDGTKVVSRDLTLGDRRELASAPVVLGGLAADASNVYFTDTNAGTIERASLAGGGSTRVLAGEDAPHTIVVSGSMLYWGTRIAIRQAKVGIFSPTSFIRETPDTPDLLVDGSYLYYRSISGEIVRVAASNPGSRLVLAFDQRRQNPFGKQLAVDDTYIYWFAFDEKLRRLPK